MYFIKKKLIIFGSFSAFVFSLFIISQNCARSIRFSGQDEKSSPDILVSGPVLPSVPNLPSGSLNNVDLNSTTPSNTTKATPLPKVQGQLDNMCSVTRSYFVKLSANALTKTCIDQSQLYNYFEKGTTCLKEVSIADIKIGDTPKDRSFSCSNPHICGIASSKNTIDNTGNVTYEFDNLPYGCLAILDVLNMDASGNFSYTDTNFRTSFLVDVPTAAYLNPVTTQCDSSICSSTANLATPTGFTSTQTNPGFTSDQIPKITNVSVDTKAKCESASIAVDSTGAGLQFSFDDGLTWQNSNTLSIVKSASIASVNLPAYTIKVKSKEGFVVSYFNNISQSFVSCSTQTTASSTSPASGTSSNGGSTTPKAYTISGSFGTGAANAKITGCGISVNADASGAFTMSGVASGTACNNFAASPTGKTCTVTNNGPLSLLKDMIGVVVGSCSAQTFTVNGNLGATANGASISICGKTGTVGSDGGFSITGVPQGANCSLFKATLSGKACTLTKAGPSNLTSSITLSGSCVTAYSISGKITGPGAIGATISGCGNASLYNANSDSNGNFTIQNIPTGANCSDLAVYTFTQIESCVINVKAPSSLTSNVSNVAGSCTTSVKYMVSGQISINGYGATVTGCGGLSTTVTDIQGGSFAFNNVPYGTNCSDFKVTKSGLSCNITTQGSAYLTQSSYVIGNCDLLNINGNLGSSGAGAYITGCSGKATTASSTGSFSIYGIAPGTNCSDFVASLSGKTCTISSNGPSSIADNNTNISGSCSSTPVKTVTISGKITGGESASSNIQVSCGSQNAIATLYTGEFSISGIPSGTDCSGIKASLTGKNCAIVLPTNKSLSPITSDVTNITGSCSSFACTGDLPNSTICSGSDQNLNGNIQKTAVSSCASYANSKCVYSCNSGYVLDSVNNKCVPRPCYNPPDSTITNLCPGSDINVPDSVTYGTVVSSCSGVNKCEYTCKSGYVKDNNGCSKVACAVPPTCSGTHGALCTTDKCDAGGACTAYPGNPTKAYQQWVVSDDPNVACRLKCNLGYSGSDCMTPPSCNGILPCSQGSQCNKLEDVLSSTVNNRGALIGSPTSYNQAWSSSSTATGCKLQCISPWGGDSCNKRCEAKNVQITSAANNLGTTQICTANLPLSAPGTKSVSATIDKQGSYSLDCQSDGTWAASPTISTCPAPADILDASCGSSNGGSFDTIPSANLCGTGSTLSGYVTGGSNVTSPYTFSNWTWVCVGSQGSGGTVAKTKSCSASYKYAPAHSCPTGLGTYNASLNKCVFSGDIQSSAVVGSKLCQDDRGYLQVTSQNNLSDYQINFNNYSIDKTNPGQFCGSKTVNLGTLSFPKDANNAPIITTTNQSQIKIKITFSNADTCNFFTGYSGPQAYIPTQPTKEYPATYCDAAGVQYPSISVYLYITVSNLQTPALSNCNTGATLASDGFCYTK